MKTFFAYLLATIVACIIAGTLGYFFVLPFSPTIRWHGNFLIFCIGVAIISSIPAIWVYFLVSRK